MAVLRVRKPASGNTLSFARANRVTAGLLVAAAATPLHDNVAPLGASARAAKTC